MVKGISRQVIVVRSPDQKLFEQAIFILKDDVVNTVGITDEMLLKAANKLVNTGDRVKKSRKYYYGPVWALSGALLTGGVWLLTLLM